MVRVSAVDDDPDLLHPMSNLPTARRARRPSVPTVPDSGVGDKSAEGRPHD
jgi:hypothetical protein